MSDVSVQPARDLPTQPTRLVVSSVLNLRSVGISRYATLLADALSGEEITYRLVRRRACEGATHFHLANSSRSLLLQSRRSGSPFVVTVHDIVPRTRGLLPLYRALAYPQIARRAAAAIVHTTHAADMLIGEAGRPRRLEVIPHAARRPRETDRGTARRALGWPDDQLIAVLPGAIRTVKLVDEALVAADGALGWRLALAGRLADRRLARAAAARGVLIVPDPDDRDYERAIVAADLVLCLRSGSVGETNGPLLDALGAGRTVLATATGSIPEVAGDAVRYCDGTASSIRTSLVELGDPTARAELERLAAERGNVLTWKSSAELHAALFREVLGA